MIVICMVASILSGLAAHQSKPVIDSCFKHETYNRLVSYSCGVILMQPLAVLMDHSLEVEHERTRHLIANLLTALFFGIGTLAGYALDVAHDKE